MKIRKITSTILIAIIIMNMMTQITRAVDFNTAYIENLGQCENHLQYYKESIGKWSYIKTTMTGYVENGVLHYAYCLNKDKPGVGESENYDVNVQEILSDEMVWRAIINGFPYKTAEELGVEDDKDAFVATKQAVYSIIYNRDVESYYRGADERGERIFNALKNIVNEARNGTQTIETTNLLKIEKIGELKKENNEQYSQEFSVSSNIEMSKYQIIKIENFPEGSIITDTNNNVKNEFNGNENFKVIIPKQKILDNFEGTVEVKGKIKTYPIFYGKSYDENMQDYALTYDAYTEAFGKGKLSVNAYNSKIKILKTDKETGKPIENVEFNLKYEDGTEIGNFTTNKSGIIHVSKLKQGKIIITEIKTQNQYILDENEKEIIIGYEDEKTINITNETKKGKIKIIKISEDDNLITGQQAGTAIPNVKFKIFDSKNNLVDEIITKDDGTAITKLLKIGKYKIKEVKTGEHYILNENEIEVEITKNLEIIEIKISNKSETPPPEIPEEKPPVIPEETPPEIPKEEPPVIPEETTPENPIEEPPEIKRLPVTGY